MDLVKKGILAANGVNKCGDLSIFTRVGSGQYLMMLGPNKSCNLLLKYLTYEASPELFLIRITKTGVERYDVGKSFQIKVNQEVA